jgi:sigma-B regulation protein RsbU (phosphoserine phosphatase)
MMASPSYIEEALELQPGEMILAYTDGVTEAANEQGEEFGMGRLEALLPELRDLSPEHVGARIHAEIDRFIGNARLADDLSIAVIVRE